MAKLRADALRALRLLLNGVMYITSPDKVWALDARTGRELWAYMWTSKGGIHMGNRGVGISGNALYFETPDCNLVSLNMADGKKRWSQTDLRPGSDVLRLSSAGGN